MPRSLTVARTESSNSLGGPDADVGADERLLEIVPGLLVDRGPTPDRPERAGEDRARLAQSVTERRRDGLLDHRLLDHRLLDHRLLDDDGRLDDQLVDDRLVDDRGVGPLAPISGRHPRTARRRLELGRSSTTRGGDEADDPDDQDRSDDDQQGLHTRRSLTVASCAPSQPAPCGRVRSVRTLQRVVATDGIVIRRKLWSRPLPTSPARPRPPPPSSACCSRSRR